mmetsp:Transcript_10051/g.25144  ORF Transcript_10051/g.25144 Transcript_10051/m.25144 type:complete len:230 (+) Transcript_10051:1937-2626(+)
MGMLLLCPQHDRIHHSHHHRPLRIARLPPRLLAESHRQHIGASGFVARRLRVHRSGSVRALRRQKHRQRDGQQRSQCLHGLGPPLDDRRRLLAASDMQVWGHMAHVLPRYRFPVSDRHLCRLFRQLQHERGRLHVLCHGEHRHACPEEEIDRRRVRRQSGHCARHGYLLRVVGARLHCGFEHEQLTSDMASIREVSKVRACARQKQPMQLLGVYRLKRYPRLAALEASV